MFKKTATTILTFGVLAFGTAAAQAANYDLVGSATMVGNDIQLTNNYSQAGAAWLPTATSTSQSFSDTFSFSLRNTNGGQMADGISFALQNVGVNAVGFAGGDIGYTGLGAVGSVVQTWYNNTAGLNTTGDAYVTKSFNQGFLGAAQLVTGTETVSYNASTHTLTMNGTLNLDGTNYQVSDSTNINLAQKFGSTMYVGFTGGTGGATADQRITSVSIAPVPEPETYAMMMAGLGLLGFVARRKKAA